MHIDVTLPPDPMEELEQNKKLAEKTQLTKWERKRLKRQQKQEEGKRVKNRNTMRKIVTIVVIVFGIAGSLFALGWFFSSRPVLPPTTQQNHSEQSPPAHIVTEPIPDAIQRHMLEHSDGGGRPGIIIQYNCEAFVCENGLIENLTKLVKRYPDNVYLAPNNYDGKIILTKLGKREVLENLDEQAIRSFIE